MSRLAELRARLVGGSAECGTSAVEFALVAPVLFMIVFGIGVYGAYLGAKHNLDQLAAEAARATIPGITDQERGDLARRSVEAALRSGSLFRRDSLVIAVGADPGDADIYTVTLNFDAATLGLKGFARLLPMPPDLLRSSVSVRRGGL
jgi:hypothetical protein